MSDASRQPHKGCYLSMPPHAVSRFGVNPQHGAPPSPASPPRTPRMAHAPPARFIEDNIALCVPRLRRRHADCSPPAPAAHGPRRVAVIAPACRHPSRQPSAAADWKSQARQTPAHPRMLAPFHPQGRSAKSRRMTV